MGVLTGAPQSWEMACSASPPADPQLWQLRATMEDPSPGRSCSKSRVKPHPLPSSPFPAASTALNRNLLNGQ